MKVGEGEIVGLGETMKTTVTGVEMFRKQLDQGMAGDNVGILLRGIDRESIVRGRCAKPGTITPHTTAKAELYALSKDEVVVTHLSSMAIVHSSSSELQTLLVSSSAQGVEMVMPGDNLTVTVELGKQIAMEPGQRFAIREGGRTIGAGRIAEVIK